MDGKAKHSPTNDWDTNAVRLQAYFLHTPVPESTLFVTPVLDPSEIEPWGAPRA